MPTAILQPPALNSEPPRKRFTRSEVEQMLDTGLFAGQRFELINGDLIDKMGQNPPHAHSIQALLQWLGVVFGLAAVRVQLPIEAAAAEQERSLPEPDFVVVAESRPDYRIRHPRGDEVLLAVEVADTSARSDATTKRDLYARAGVREYWVVDLAARRIIVHRNLQQGRFESVTILSESDSVAVEARPEETIAVAALLP